LHSRRRGHIIERNTHEIVPRIVLDEFYASEAEVAIDASRWIHEKHFETYLTLDVAIDEVK